MSAITKAYHIARKAAVSAAYTLRDVVTFRRANNIVMDQPGLAAYQDSGANGPDAALQLSTVYSCVSLIAETIATLPLITYKKIAGRRDVADDHPLYAILHDSPNADETAVEFWERAIAHICLRGNAYVLKTRNTLGQIISLDLLDPDLMRKPYRDRAGEIRYDYNAAAGIRYYTQAEVWHIKGFGTDPLVGLSPIRLGLLSMMAARSADKTAAKMFGNGLRPTAVLTRQEFFTPDQRQQMKEKLAEGFFGDPDTGRMMLLEGGTAYQALSISPEEAQLLESRTFQVEDLCRWFKVNPALVGHPGTASNFGTGREQIMLNFLMFTLRPYLKRIESGIQKHLLAPSERAKYFAEYSVEGLLRADSKTRFEVYSIAVQNGLKTRNEVRALENDPPLDGGNELTVQSNLIPVTLLGKITNTAQAAKSAMLDWLGLAPKEKPDETQG
jgi:HK97 family phage portal protein